MAYYNISHKCQHREVHYVFEPCIEDKVEKLKIELCSECQELQKEAAHEKAYDKAYEQTHNLEPIVGTPKQVQWATTIRAARIQDIENKIKENGPLPDNCKQAFEDWSNINNASYWIENRNSSGIDMFRDCLD
jgi:hypothetical protein